MGIKSERRFISMVDVKPGMMLEFNYTKKDRTSDKYTVLVVDPDRQNDHANEPQLHAVLIDELSDRELVELFASFRTEINMNPYERKESVVTELNSDGAYESFINSRFGGERKYRTFNRSAMSGVRQILLGMVED